MAAQKINARVYLNLEGLVVGTIEFRKNAGGYGRLKIGNFPAIGGCSEVQPAKPARAGNLIDRKAKPPLNDKLGVHHLAPNKL